MRVLLEWLFPRIEVRPLSRGLYSVADAPVISNTSAVQHASVLVKSVFRVLQLLGHRASLGSNLAGLGPHLVTVILL